MCRFLHPPSMQTLNNGHCVRVYSCIGYYLVKNFDSNCKCTFANGQYLLWLDSGSISAPLTDEIRDTSMLCLLKVVWIGRVHITCMEGQTMPWDAPPHSVLCTLDEPVSRMMSCFLMGKINSQNDVYIVTQLPKICAAYDIRDKYMSSLHTLWAFD